MTRRRADFTAQDYDYRSHRDSKTAQVEEPQGGYWSSNVQWGDKVTGQPLPTSAGEVVQIAYLPVTAGPPRVHGIHLYRSDREINSVVLNADVRARVRYTVGAAQNDLLLDWISGTQFSLVANSIRIDAVTYAPREPAYQADARLVTLGAMFGAGTAPTGYALPSFTERGFQAIAGGAETPFFVPDHAREVAVHLVNNNDPQVVTNVQLNFRVAGGGQLTSSYDAQVCAGGRRIPIPGGTSVLGVDNNAGANVLCFVQWFLGL